MRVGIFTDTYFPQVSGVATSIRILKQQLEANGHTVVIFTTSDPKAPAFEEGIVRLRSIPLFAFKERRIAIQGLGKAYRIAKEYDLDIIHTQTEFSLGLLGQLLATMLKIPIVHTYHTMYEKYLHYIAKGKVLRPVHVKYLSREFCNQTDGVIAPSLLTKNKLLSYGVLQEVHVIPTGVMVPEMDAEKAQAIRSKLGYTADDCVLLSLSRLSKEKNIQAIIEALPELIAKRKEIKLCVVGAGPERENLEMAVERLNIGDAVLFVGEIDHDQVTFYYQMADLYVNASESESQGLTYLEALVNKTPVIAKKNAYLSELISDDLLGSLFETDEQLANQILSYLARHQITNDQMLDRILTHTVQEISAETFGNRVLNVYDAALAGYNWELMHKKRFKIRDILKFPSEDDLA